MSLEQRTAKDIIRRIRNDLEDQVEPYLWSDTELLDYINEAQTEFCNVDIGVPIIDSVTPEVCEYPFKAGDTVLESHPSIIHITEAFRDDEDGTGRLTPLFIRTQSAFIGMVPPTDDYGNNFSGSHGFTQAARVTTILTDHSEDTIRLASPADQAGIIRLRVTRGPKQDITDCKDRYEVKRKYEPALVAWANRLAYLKQDAETFDPKAADRWQERFDRIAERANLEYLRRYSTPGPIQCQFP
jgi:hypothetical protein